MQMFQPDPCRETNVREEREQKCGAPRLHAERGHPPNKQGRARSNTGTIIITPLKQWGKKPVFCGMSVALTAPEERSRDHICTAIIRQEGFQKSQRSDSEEACWQHMKKSACASIHLSPPPSFIPTPKIFCSLLNSSHIILLFPLPTHTRRHADTHTLWLSTSKYDGTRRIISRRQR